MKPKAKKAVRPKGRKTADPTPAYLRHLAQHLEAMAAQMEEDVVNNYIRDCLKLPE